MAEADPKTSESPAGRPLVRDYSAVALGALAVSGLILYFERLGIWGLVVVLVGVVGVLVRWGLAAGLFLVLLTVFTLFEPHVSFHPGRFRRRGTDMTDLILAVAVVAYVAAQLRLQTLTRFAVPPDPRRQFRPPGKRVKGRWLLPTEPAHRTTAEGNPGEVVLLLIGAAIFVLVASLLWFRLASESPPMWVDFPPPLWHIVVVVWSTVLALAAMHAFLAYLGRTYAGRDESLLYLQDQLWTATRGEQRRLNRWLAWARLRRQRKEEAS
jgi:hypothetical protein